MSSKKSKRIPDRVDFKIRPDGKVIVQRFWRIGGRYKPLSQEVKETVQGQFRPRGALKWLDDHGYEVIRWAGTDDPDYPLLWPGARVLKKLRPIRT
jgi:hypothetical protein